MARARRGATAPPSPDPADGIKPLLTYEEFADLWSVSRTTVFRWIRAGIVQRVKRGSVSRITREEHLRLLRESVA